MNIRTPGFITTKSDHRLAYHQLDGQTSHYPGIIFLGGFMSDMNGTKATFFEEFCRQQGFGYVRFDYTGHGQSSGKFEEGTISAWTEDTLAVLDEITQGPQILVGSSMGGWVMVLAALQRKARIAGLMGIAAAPDFVQPLILDKLSHQHQKEIETKGVCYIPVVADEEPFPISLKFIQDGKQQIVLNKSIDLQCPIRLVHGLEDSEVPWEFSQKLLERSTSNDVTLTLVKNGDHRLSKPHELAILADTLKALVSSLQLEN